MATPQAPAEVVWNLVNAHAQARCMHMVAEFGVADALGEAPATAAELADRIGMDADALDRMLRLLAAHEVFAVTAGGYAHTPASELLRSTHPQSMRAFARMIGLPVIWNGFTELRNVAVTGKPASDWARLVAYFAAHPQEAALFNQAMAEKSNAVVPAVTGAYDFREFPVVADIGGGRGHLLQAILEQSPASSGVLFEMPHVIDDAAAIASPRLQLVAGDFFNDPLPRADAYVLMEVLHDWSDEDAIRILAAAAASAEPEARLLVVEALVPEAPGPHQGKTLDILMLAITGGRERTAAEYAALLELTGWKTQRVVSTPSTHSLVEAALA